MTIMAMSSCVCRASVLDTSASNDTFSSLQQPAARVIHIPERYEEPKTPKVEETKKSKWNASMYGSNEVTGATADDLNNLIDKIIDYRGLSYSPFKNKGETLVEIETEYGVSAVALLSIWTWESGFGNSSLARDRNNFGGIKNGDGGYRYFDSIEIGMLSSGQLIGEAYIQKGYIQYTDIASKYCPGNYEWAGNVSGTASRYASWLEEIM